MNKIATLATAAALFAGVGTCAFAQAPAANTPPAAAQDQGQQGRPRLSQDDFNRLVDARIAAIKAGLKLNGDQEKLWGPVESAIRDAASQRYTRMTQFRENREQRGSTDFMQRLEQRSTMQAERAQTSATLAKSLRPLWDSFSEDQKRIAPRLLREAVNDGIGRQGRGGRDGRQGRHAEMMRHHGPMGSGEMGPGPRGPAPQQ